LLAPAWEYGLGRRCTDLLVLWNFPGGVQRAVIEITLLYGVLSQTVTDGLAQTWAYADGCGAEERLGCRFWRPTGFG
jgi:hypothetical protein